MGAFGLTSLAVSTKALHSDDPADATYVFLENEIAALTKTRDALSKQIITVLEGEEFHGKSVSATEARLLSHQAQQLLKQMDSLTH